MFWKYVYLIIWFGLVTFASLSSPKNLPEIQLFEHFDKVIHFSMYFGLSFLFVPVFLRNNKYKICYLISAITSLLIGITFEVLQMTITTQRSGDIYDAIANFAGALSGVVIYQLLIRGKKWERLIFKI